MPSTGQDLRLGPFIGGLNTLSDPSAIADAELADCVNLELDIDGSLVCRPPIQEVLTNTSFAERILLLGVAQISGNTYLIGSNSGGVYYWISNAWTLITNTFQATCMVQYADKAWLIAKPGSANPGGSWDGAVFTAISAIPKGSAAAIHKERLYVVPGASATSNSSRLTFSTPADFTTWPGTNFIDVKPGDGQQLIDLTVYQNNILLFKQDSTYLLAYDTNPSLAIVTPISTTLGATKAHCVANFENSVFVYHEGEIYEIINLDFNRINTKIPFTYDPAVPTSGGSYTEDVFLSIFGDRLLVRYFNRVYVYGLKTRTWSRWQSQNEHLHYFGPLVAYPSNVVVAVNDQYYAGSCINVQKNLVRLNDGYDSVVNEAIARRINLILNPSFETNLTGYTPGGFVNSPTITQDTTHVESGTKAMKIAWPVDTLPQVSYTIAGLTVGATYVAQLRAFIPSANGEHIRIFSSAGSVIGEASSEVDGFTDVFVKFIATAVTNVIQIWPANAAGLTGSELTWVDKVLCWEGSVLTTPFDGDSANASWTGVAHASTSISLANEAVVITCTALTKTYDMAVSHKFKKLFWWGADVLTSNEVIGVASPIITVFQVTWDELSAYTWDQLNTWQFPLSSPASVTTAQSPGSGVLKKFVRFLKGLRFRQINFSVIMTSSGMRTDGPARLYTITAVVSTKQVVPAGSN
jgi:hypothetical protein